MKVALSFSEALKLAIEQHRGGNYAHAESVLRRLARTKPGHELVEDLLMQALFNQGKTADAMARYDEAVGRGAYACPADFDAVYRRALIVTRYCPSPLARRAKFATLLALLEPALALDGSAAECGCYRGLSTYLMLNCIRLHDPAYTGSGFHVFDSFAGLGAPTSHDEIAADHPNADNLRYMSRPGAFSATLDEVRLALSEFPQVEYHPGWIPASFEGLPERGYRFVHLDVDMHEPTRAALEYFWPRIMHGGVIVCDDYGWPGARRAIEDYCAKERLDFSVTAHQQAVMARR
jgi:O-methyltransferase